jgi:hypothetical protein
MAAMTKNSREVKWSVGGTIESMMTHEFGHQVQHWLEAVPTEIQRMVFGQLVVRY